MFPLRSDAQSVASGVIYITTLSVHINIQYIHSSHRVWNFKFASHCTVRTSDGRTKGNRLVEMSWIP